MVCNQRRGTTGRSTRTDSAPLRAAGLDRARAQRQQSTQPAPLLRSRYRARDAYPQPDARPGGESGRRRGNLAYERPYGADAGGNRGGDAADTRSAHGGDAPTERYHRTLAKELVISIE